MSAFILRVIWIVQISFTHGWHLKDLSIGIGTLWEELGLWRGWVNLSREDSCLLQSSGFSRPYWVQLQQLFMWKITFVLKIFVCLKLCFLTAYWSLSKVDVSLSFFLTHAAFLTSSLLFPPCTPSQASSWLLFSFRPCPRASFILDCACVPLLLSPLILIAWGWLGDWSLWAVVADNTQQ